jgi:molecular chaperone DnaK
VESAVSDLKEALKGDDKGTIEAKLKSLGEASVGIAQKVFEEAQNKAKESQGNDSSSESDSVVDAEYEEVNEEVNEEEKPEENKS